MAQAAGVEKIRPEGSAGRLDMAPSARAGRRPSAMAGGPSMIRFTQRIWMAVKGTGSPSHRTRRGA
jgi:hypothetical protein